MVLTVTAMTEKATTLQATTGELALQSQALLQTVGQGAEVCAC